MSDEPYALRLGEKAKDSLKKMEKPLAERILRKLKRIAGTVKDINHNELKGEWAGYYRYRIGDYRAIYDLNHTDKIITVIVIGHRKNVYDE